MPTAYQNDAPMFLDPIEQQAQKKRLLAKALAAQGQQPGSQMIGDVYVPPSILQRAAALGSHIGSSYIGNQAQELEAQAAQNRNVQANQWMQEMSKPYDTEVTGDDGTVTRKPLLGRALRAEQARRLGMAPPSMADEARKAQMELVLKKPESPSAIGGNMYYDPESGEVKRGPIDEEAAKQKWFELETRRQDAVDRAADRRQSMEDRRTATAEANDLKRQQIAMMGEVARIRADAAGPKSESKTNAKAFADQNARAVAASGLQAAIDKLDKVDPKEFSYAKGLATEFLPGGSSVVARTRSQEANDAVQALSGEIAKIRHGYYGAALSKQEKSISEQFLPGAYDTKEILIGKLKGLREKMLRDQESAAAAGAPATSSRPSGSVSDRANSYLTGGR